MWHTTFVGDPAQYVNERRRVRFNGAGSDIHFADFAILGKLDHRLDYQANDGFSEFFGTNSSLTRVWVEHTKTGAWIANSDGMVIEDCRFPKSDRRRDQPVPRGAPCHGDQLHGPGYGR